MKENPNYNSSSHIENLFIGVAMPILHTTKTLDFLVKHQTIYSQLSKAHNQNYMILDMEGQIDDVICTI